MSKKSDKYTGTEMPIEKYITLLTNLKKRFHNFPPSFQLEVIGLKKPKKVFSQTKEEN